MTIRLPIVSKFDPTGVNQAQGALGSLSRVASSAGAIVTAAFVAVGAATVQVGIESVKAASNFTEVTTAVEQIFGSAAKSLEDFAKTAPQALGQTRTQFLDAAKTFGIFGQAAGLAGEENVAFTKQLTILASDLASFNNTSVDEAITAIGAGLRGESEPLRRFGVLLDDATLRSRALAMGIYDGSGSLTQQQKVLAAQAEIMAQTTTQQGDFARTQNGLANGARTLTAVWNDLQITIGQALMPAIQEVLPIITKTIESMAADPRFQQFIVDLGKAFSDLAPSVVDLLPALMDLVQAIIPVIVAWMPALIAMIQAVADAFAGSKGDTKEWASFVGFMADAVIWLVGAIQSAVYWLGQQFDAMSKGKPSIIGLIAPITVLIANINNISTAIQGAISWWNELLGIEQSKPVGRINFSTGDSNGGLKLAAGGIVMPKPGGTMATIGEAGQAEAVIPLDRLGAMMSGGGGGGGGYVININGGLASSADIGRAVVDAIKKFERTSGPVFASA